MTLNAQTPADFSGKWEFDKARSDKDDTGDASFDGTIIMEIKQNSKTVSFANTFTIPGKKPVALPPDSFQADGSVTTDNSGSDPAKKFLKWSKDKKILTTSYVMTASVDGVPQDFITAMSYRLSDGGKTLIVEEMNKSRLNGERTVKKVYKKK